MGREGAVWKPELHKWGDFREIATDRLNLCVQYKDFL